MQQIFLPIFRRIVTEIDLAHDGLTDRTEENHCLANILPRKASLRFDKIGYIVTFVCLTELLEYPHQQERAPNICIGTA